MEIFSKFFPKKKKSSSFLPEFLTTVSSGSQITDSRVNQANTDLTSLRYGASTEEIIRDYAKNSTDVSHAIESYIRFCITDSFSVVAKDINTGTIDSDATKFSQVLTNRLNRLPRDYGGFSPQSSINATSESLILNLLTNGSLCAEVVLDKSYLPSTFQAISTDDLKYELARDRHIPYIDQSSGAVYLDFPTVYIASLTQDPNTAYSDSWFKSVVQNIISSAELTNDLRKSFRKAALPRVSATIDTEKFIESLGPDVAYDDEKKNKKMTATLTGIEEKLNGLNPEDAIVNFDIITVDHLSAGNISSHESVATHASLVNGQVATGLHVLPSLLGRGESQSTASTETVLFLKIAESIQQRLNEVYSYLLTVSLRLHGYDCFVEFKYKKPSLRPEIEEESFASMKQSRVLELLSYGIISDEEASISLTGDLPSGNYEPLSGTRFRDGKTTQDISNPYSNTSVSSSGVTETKDQKDRSTNEEQPKTNGTTG